MSASKKPFLQHVAGCAVPALFIGAMVLAAPAYGGPSPVYIRVLTVRKAVVQPLAHCHTIMKTAKAEGASATVFATKGDLQKEHQK